METTKKTARVLLWRPSLGGVGEHGPSQKSCAGHRPRKRRPTQFSPADWSPTYQSALDGSICTRKRRSPLAPAEFFLSSHRIFHSAPGFLHKIHELNIEKGLDPPNGIAAGLWSTGGGSWDQGTKPAARPKLHGLPGIKAWRTMIYLRLGTRLAGARR